MIETRAGRLLARITLPFIGDEARGFISVTDTASLDRPKTWPWQGILTRHLLQVDLRRWLDEQFPTVEDRRDLPQQIQVVLATLSKIQLEAIQMGEPPTPTVRVTVTRYVRLGFTGMTLHDVLTILARQEGLTIGECHNVPGQVNTWDVELIGSNEAIDRALSETADHFGDRCHVDPLSEIPASFTFHRNN